MPNNPNVDKTALSPNSSSRPVPTHTTAATGIITAAIIRRMKKRERVSRQHFQKYIPAPFEQAVKRFHADLAE
jgi:hypothetical protein